MEIKINGRVRDRNTDAKGRVVTYKVTTLGTAYVCINHDNPDWPNPVWIEAERLESQR